MKILAQAISGNHIHGFQHHFMQKGHQWIWWEENHTPAFDVFDEVQPDIFFGCGMPSRAVGKCLSTYKPATIFQAGEYKFVIGEDLIAYTFLVNPAIHRPNTPEPKLVCDIACCEKPHRDLLSICHPIGRFNIKITGKTPWPTPQYIGPMTGPQMVRLYQSAKIVYANTLEEIGRGMACGCVCVTSNLSISQAIEPVIYIAHHEDMDAACEYLLKHKDNQNNIIEQSLRFIEQNELTYDKAFTSVCLLLNKQGIRI